MCLKASNVDKERHVADDDAAEQEWRSQEKNGGRVRQQEIHFSVHLLFTEADNKSPAVDC